MCYNKNSIVQRNGEIQFKIFKYVLIKRCIIKCSWKHAFENEKNFNMPSVDNYLHLQLYVEYVLGVLAFPQKI